MKRFLSLIRFFTTTVIAMLAVCALAWLSHPVAAAELRAANAPARVPDVGWSALHCICSCAQAPSMHELPFARRLPTAGRRRTSAYYERTARFLWSWSNRGKMRDLPSGPQSRRGTFASRRTQLGPAASKHPDDLGGPDRCADLPVNQRPQAEPESKSRSACRAPHRRQISVVGLEPWRGSRACPHAARRICLEGQAMAGRRSTLPIT